MKNFRKVLLLILALTLTFLLFSCGGTEECKEHKDADRDGKCDVCGKEIQDKPDPEIPAEAACPSFLANEYIAYIEPSSRIPFLISE